MFKNIANIDSFLEDRDYSTNVIPSIAGVETVEIKSTKTKNGNFKLITMLSITAIIGVIAGSICYHNMTVIDSGNGVISGIFSENVLNEVNTENVAISATSGKREVISVSRSITKADPFLPYRDVSVSFNAPPKFELMEPPESSLDGSDAARVMDVAVSGILYDIYSPSAILNIEGNDHLVKKGDLISNYRVLDINKNTVTVQLGKNIYRAGIGEMLTTSDIHYNKVSNLDSKFGGKNGK